MVRAKNPVFYLIGLVHFNGTATLYHFSQDGSSGIIMRTCFHDELNFRVAVQCCNKTEVRRMFAPSERF